MTTAYMPFSFRRVPITQVALINFKKNPDVQYHAFEVHLIEVDDQQQFQVLAWRSDGYKDIYHQPGIIFNEQELELIVGGQGLGKIIPTEFDMIYFYEEAHHVRLGFSFDDCDGRAITFQLDEDVTTNPHELSWIPSIGSQMKQPKSLPLFFLYQFDFVRKKKSNVSLIIDGNTHQIDPCTFPKMLKSRWNIQYSMNTMATIFNETRHIAIQEVAIDEEGIAREGDKEYRYVDVEGHHHLQSIRLDSPTAPITITFDPPFPDKSELLEHKPHFGEFYIEPAGNLGTLKGRYNVTRQKKKAPISLTFHESWRPKKDSLYSKLIKGMSNNEVTEWFQSHQCMEIVDLEKQVVDVKWNRGNPNRR